MTKTKRPVFKDVIAYACELLAHGETQIMVEIVKAFDEQTSEVEKAEIYERGMEKALGDQPDTNDFDAMVVLAAKLHREGQRLPRELATFAADVLEGERSRPTRPGPDRHGGFIRNVALSFAVEAVAQKFGIARYAKGNTSNETAADAVSVASKYTVNTVTAAVSSHPILPAIAASVAIRLGGEFGE